MEYLTSFGSYVALVLFIGAYILVIFENKLQLQKSQPVILVAGIIWALVGFTYLHGTHSEESIAEFHNVLYDFSSLFLFLLTTMTFLNTMKVFNVFEVSRLYFVRKNFSVKQMFWMFGIISFFLSAVADNLTTALLFANIILPIIGFNKKTTKSLTKQKKSFLVLMFVNLVVATNAGGVFSPFGDVTTLMIWQQSLLHGTDFLVLFIPAIVNWLIPAFILSFFLPKNINFIDSSIKNTKIKKGGIMVIVLFVVSIIMAVLYKQIFGMPPVLGMVTGLSLLQFYAWFSVRRWEKRITVDIPHQEVVHYENSFDIYSHLEMAEWDTLMFFYGVVLSVGGLAAFGQLEFLSIHLIDGLGASIASVILGLASSIIDNIPIMYAVISMHPHFTTLNWLLATLSIGVGGSILSIGSAPGVALMGKAGRFFNFLSYLKWSWAIILGYFASIGTLLLIDHLLF